MEILEVGMSYRLAQKVENKDLAITYGSGGLPVYATPGMIALMEGAAYLLGKQEPHNVDTVGIEINVRHNRACKEGANVYAIAELTQIDGKRLYFKVTTYDENGEIGNADHIRYIIDAVKFMERLG